MMENCDYKSGKRAREMTKEIDGMSPDASKRVERYLS